jgi:hypothetical protein
MWQHKHKKSATKAALFLNTILILFNTQLSSFNYAIIGSSLHKVNALA